MVAEVSTTANPSAASAVDTVAREGHTQKQPARVYLSLALGVTCIGFSAIFTKWANVDGAVAGLYRVGIATIVLGVPFLFQLLRRKGRGETLASGGVGLRTLLGVTAMAGIFFALDLTVWNTSMMFTSAANSTLLGNTSTLWVSLGAMFLFHQSLKRRFWLGMALALVGAAVIVGRDVLQQHSLGWGDLMAVASSLFYAGYLLSTGKARKYLDTLSFMWLSSCAAAIALLIFCVAMGLKLWDFTLDQYLALFSLAIISHVIGWMAINYSLGHLPAPIAAVSLLSQPVVTAIAAWPLLNEPLSIFQVGGGLLVLAGIYIVNRR